MATDNPQAADPAPNEPSPADARQPWQQSALGRPLDAELQRTLQNLVRSSAVENTEVMRRALQNLTRSNALARNEAMKRMAASLTRPNALARSEAMKRMAESLTRLQPTSAERPLRGLVGGLITPQMPHPMIPANETRRLPARRPQPSPAWREAGVQFKRRIFGLLIQVDASLIVRLDGAWERISRGGPHSTAQAAHSAVEFVDWCLRTVAPDEIALNWHSETGRSSDELHQGRPTRALRMRYLLRHRDPDGALATEYVRHCLSALKLLQAARHSEHARRNEVAALILSIESVLAFLLLDEDSNTGTTG